MYACRTTMTRLIHRLRERTVVSPITKQFRLRLTGALLGVVMLSGVVAAQQGPYESEYAKSIRKLHKSVEPGDDDTVSEWVYRKIVARCFKYPTKEQQFACEATIFFNLCPKAVGARWSKEGCARVARKLRAPRIEDGNEGNQLIPIYACSVTRENGDQLCLITPATTWSGDLLPISIDISDFNCAEVADVGVTVQVSASGAELSQPYRDPENPGEFDLTWTGGPYNWVGTATLASVSSTASAQPVFGMGVVPSNDSVSITADVDYTCDGMANSADVTFTVEALSETVEIPE